MSYKQGPNFASKADPDFLNENSAAIAIIVLIFFYTNTKKR